ATRLWSIDAVNRLDEAARVLQQTMIDQAHGLETALMPSYTHLQRAIPVSAAHWLLSRFWQLERDRVRLKASQRSASVLPLGSGAAAGSAYPVSRGLLQGSLGFYSSSANSVGAGRAVCA